MDEPNEPVMSASVGFWLGFVLGFIATVSTTGGMLLDSILGGMLVGFLGSILGAVVGFIRKERVDGIEFCARHRGIMTEGTDYIGECGMGCEYPENEEPGDCIPVPLYTRKAHTS